MTELHQNLINGEWVGGEGVENINPSNTNEVVGVYARATAQDTLDAIAAAKAAFPARSSSSSPAKCCASQVRACRRCVRASASR